MPSCLAALLLVLFFVKIVASEETPIAYVGDVGNGMKTSAKPEYFNDTGTNGTLFAELQNWDRDREAALSSSRHARTLDDNPSKLQTLKTIDKELKQMVAAESSFNETHDYLSAVFDHLLLLPTSQEPMDDEESRMVTAVVQDMGKLIAKRLDQFLTLSVTARSRMDVRTFKQIAEDSNYDVKRAENAGIYFLSQMKHSMAKSIYFVGVKGYEIQTWDDYSFTVGTTNIFPKFQFKAYMVFPQNTSPLRPLPVADLPVESFQLINLIFQEPDTTYYDISMLSIKYIPTIGVLGISWTYENRIANIQHGCARWHEAEGAWTSEGCAVIKSTLQIPRIVYCYCGFKSTDRGISEYILYEYKEDIGATIRLEQTNVSFTGPDVSAELKKHGKIFEEMVANHESFYECLSQLSVVMSFNNSDLVDTLDDRILKDIGTILYKAEPDAGKSTTGIVHNDIASFLITLDSYKRDPPIGFGMYNDPSWGMEYFRLAKEIDFGMIFSKEVAFSFLLSKSVASQNSRFAFLIYPPGKFFKPSDIIDGHQVSSMRVLDIVLTPSNQHNKTDQLLHLFSGRILDTYLAVGCAYWNATLGGWTSDNCYPNPGLYNGVCTCNMSANFAESPTRGQYIVFTYFQGILFVSRPSDYIDQRLASTVSVFCVHQYLDSSIVCQDIFNLIRYLKDATYANILLPSAQKQVTHDSRFIVLKNNCHLASFDDIISTGQVKGINTFFPICYDLDNKHKLTGFDITLGSQFSKYESLGDINGSKVSNRNIIGLHLSDSVLTENEKYAFLLYPKRTLFYPPPRVRDHIIQDFQMVDIILKPAIRTQNADVEQFVLFYYDHPANWSTGCAFWSDELVNWTITGCNVVNINAVDACNCSLTTNFDASRSGGQYIVYSYPTYDFNMTLYDVIGAEKFADTTAIKTQGAELIHNASLLMYCADAKLATQMVRIYHKILAHTKDVAQSKEVFKQIFHDMEKAFKMFDDCFDILSDDPYGIIFIYNMPTVSWSDTTSEQVNYMFSNVTLLHADNIEDHSTSASTFAAIGLVKDWGRENISIVYGIYFSRNQSSVGQPLTLSYELDGNMVLNSRVIDLNPTFACYTVCLSFLMANRYFMAIYPLNLSPYPYSMTTRPVFNSRQVDIYNPNSERFYFSSDEQQNFGTVNVFFKPTDESQPYIIITCASWDEIAEDWTTDLCAMIDVAIFPNAICHCNLTTRAVTRIVIYEYTNTDNFSLIGLFNGPRVVFLIGSSFSLLGFVMIAITAILFPSRKSELSNKILIHLASSSFLYLCMTMFRETHLIYIDMKHLDLALVAFTACVHYTRLVHHCWGLVMSVLQYRRFSSEVGASTISHLLLKVSLLAWGIPGGMVLVLLTWDVRAHFCSPDKVTHFVLYFVPVIVITLLNIGLLIATIWHMTNGCGCCGDKELQKHGGGSNKDVLWRQLKQLIMMYVLFGIPAVFETFNIIFNSVVMDYIDKILNPIQGFMIFLVFVVIDDKTRALWNAGVFGDVTPVAKPKPIMKVAVKPKTPKKAKKPKNAEKQENSPDATEVAAAAGQNASVEPEIQIVKSDTTGIEVAVKYVVQSGGEAGKARCTDTASELDGVCAAQKDGEEGNSDIPESLINNTLLAAGTFASEPRDGQERQNGELSKVLANYDGLPPLNQMLTCVEDLHRFSDHVTKRLASLKELQIADVVFGDSKTITSCTECSDAQMEKMQKIVSSFVADYARDLQMAYNAMNPIVIVAQSQHLSSCSCTCQCRSTDDGI